MFKVILLLIAITGEHAVVDPSPKVYETKAKCEAAMKGEVKRINAIFEKRKIPVAVEASRCFSLDEINQMKGGRNADAPVPDEEKVD